MRRVASLRSVACGALALLAPGLAHAANGTHPRTPVVWSDVECATLVDRSAATVWHLDYDIPYEDLDVSEDEVADSRTHQFFAMCRDNSPQDYLPRWITGADIASAAAMNLVDPRTVDPADVFETSTEWADCWFRINADDQRLPISNASAAAGVDWDLTGLPAGGYVIHGYTYEPAINVWVQRPGFVKIHDGDPDAAPPAIAITTGELVLESDGVGTIEGCVDAMQGSTITAYWAPAESGEVTWTPFLEDEPVAGAQFSIDLAAPAELVGDTGMVRVDVTDPQGRTYSGYGLETIIVLAPTGGDDGCEGGGFVQGGECSDSGDGTAGGSATGDDAATGPIATGSGDGADGSTGTPAADEGGSGGGGCACSSTPMRGSAALFVLPVLVGLVRARRRAGASA